MCKYNNMDLELFLILALIVVFLVSCCGLIQKIRENYDEDRGRVISVTQIHVPNQAYSNTAYSNDDLSTGVFPSNLSPPPYAEHSEPPPRYEDLVKDNQFTVIQISPPAATPAVNTSQNTRLPTVSSST